MIYEKIKELCKKNRTNISRLESELGFARGSLCKIDKNKPSADRLKKIADYFGIEISELLGEEQEHHYIDDTAREYARFLHSNPEYGVLFDASRKIKAEDIDIVRQLLDKFRESEQ